jgi:hypothetical protein
LLLLLPPAAGARKEGQRGEMIVVVLNDRLGKKVRVNATRTTRSAT